MHVFSSPRRNDVVATCVNLGAYVSRSDRPTNNLQLIYDAELDRFIINLPNENKFTDIGPIKCKKMTVISKSMLGEIILVFLFPMFGEIVLVFLFPMLD